MTLPAKLWYVAEYAAARVLLFVLAILPLPLLFALTSFAARLVFFCWRSRAEVAVTNLLEARICDTRFAAKSLALESFRTFAIMVAEAVVAKSRLRKDNWDQFVTLRLTPEAEALLRQPETGILVASAHIGNWEIAARAVSMLKPMCVVYRPFNNPYLDRYLHEARGNERLHLISRLEQNPMRFVQALARGEMLALMVDQHVKRGGVQVDYFGRPAWTTKSVAMLHLTTRAPLVVAYAIREGPLKYSVYALGPLVCQRTGDRERDAFEITQTVTREIEKIARRYPEQYMWGHRRWK